MTISIKIKLWLQKLVSTNIMQIKMEIITPVCPSYAILPLVRGYITVSVNQSQKWRETFSTACNIIMATIASTAIFFRSIYKG